jgi:hypothetical protein
VEVNTSTSSNCTATTLQRGLRQDLKPRQDRLGIALRFKGHQNDVVRRLGGDRTGSEQGETDGVGTIGFDDVLPTRRLRDADARFGVAGRDISQRVSDLRAGVWIAYSDGLAKFRVCDVGPPRLPRR